MAYRFDHDVLYQQSIGVIPGRDTDVRIPKGQSTEGMAKQLKELGLIWDTWTFRMQSLLLGRKVHVGEYRPSTSEIIDEMLELSSTVPEKRRSGKS